MFFESISVWQLLLLYTIVGFTLGWAVFGTGPLMQVTVNNALPISPTKAPYIRPSRRKHKPLLGGRVESKAEELPPIPGANRVGSQAKNAKIKLNHLEGNT